MVFKELSQKTQMKCLAQCMAKKKKSIHFLLFISKIYVQIFNKIHTFQ